VNKGIGTIFGVLFAIQVVFTVTAKAWLDYGWLGGLIAFGLSFSLMPLVPLVGWFFLPASQVVWMWVLAALSFAHLYAAEEKSKKMRAIVLVAAYIFCLILLALIAETGTVKQPTAGQFLDAK
jgi:hypothetical protein